MSLNRTLSLLRNTSDSIFVNANGDTGRSQNGSLLEPYRTIAGAIAAATSSRNQLVVFPGTYTEAQLTLPTTYGLSIYGLGNRGDIAINAAAAVTRIFYSAPGAASGTCVYKFGNLSIDCVETSQIGLQVDNTSALHKSLYIFDNCHIEEDDGTSIDIDHAGVPTVRVYMHNCEVEGAINFDVGNPQDRIWATDCEIMGLLTTAGDNVLAEFRYMNCLTKHATTAVNSGLTTQTFMSLGTKTVVVTDDELTARTYAALDTNDIGAGGDFTETIVN